MIIIGQNNIRTYARIKPLMSYEEQKVFFKKSANLLYCKSNDEDFKFNQVFDEYSTNQTIFNSTYSQMIQHNFNGYNSCILAYGQTSSGKTYTMKGTKDNPGIIPLCIQEIFAKVSNSQMGAQLTISYFQIYNQNVYDLLSKDSKNALDIRGQKQNLNIANLSQIKVSNSDQAMSQFERGQINRKFADNNINNKSSRSHVIFRINLKLAYQQQNELKQVCSQINMVDLAGSQSINKTKAEGDLKKQGQNINKSILALSIAIKSMSQKQKYINFRDSKLTRILQNSLCNNSKSIIICTLNSNRQNLQQSLKTVRFGAEASQVQIFTKQNMKFKKTQAKFDYNEIETSQSIKQDKEKNNQINKLNYQLIQYQRRYLQKQKEFEQLKQSKQEILNLNYFLINQNQTLKFKLKEKQNLNNQQLFKEERQSIINKSLQFQQKYLMYKRKHDQLVDLYRTSSRNQKDLVDKLNQYQKQIAQLQETVQNKNYVENAKNNFKNINQKMKNRFYDSPFDSKKKISSPITVMTVIELKQQILRSNKQLHSIIQENSNLNQIIKNLNNQIDILRKQPVQHKNYKDDEQQSNSKYKKIQKRDQKDRQIQKLKRKIQKLKLQNITLKQRQNNALKKTKTVIKMNEILLKELEQKSKKQDLSLNPQFKPNNKSNQKSAFERQI